MSKSRKKKKKDCVHNWKFVKEITLGNKIFIKWECFNCGAVKTPQKKERIYNK